MAKKKSTGSLRNGRDSIGKRLGVKCLSGCIVKPGMIIVRQKGLNFKPGINCSIGKDYTIFALKYGTVCYKNLYISVI